MRAVAYPESFCVARIASAAFLGVSAGLLCTRPAGTSVTSVLRAVGIVNALAGVSVNELFRDLVYAVFDFGAE